MGRHNLVLRVSDSFGLDRYLPLGYDDRGRESVVGSIVFIDRGSVIEGNLRSSLSATLSDVGERGMQVITRPRPSMRHSIVSIPRNTHHVQCTLSSTTHVACGRGFGIMQRTQNGYHLQ